MPSHIPVGDGTPSLGRVHREAHSMNRGHLAGTSGCSLADGMALVLWGPNNTKTNGHLFSVMS